MISPPIMVLALPSLVLAGGRIVRRLPSRAVPAAPGPRAARDSALAWFLGTFLPFGC